MFQELKTPRLTIRHLKPSDVDGLYNVLRDADVMRYIEPPFSREQTASFVQTYGLCDNPKMFALIYDKSKQLIGHLIFHPFDDDTLERKYGKGKVWELGWIIAKAYWHQSLATETTRHIIEYAKQAGIRALVIECDPQCVATINIAAKFGFAQTSPTSSLSQTSLLTFVLPL